MQAASQPTIDAATLDATSADALLVQRSAAGDHAAFALLMRRHNRMMYRAARSILKDDAEAEDAVQEAYLLAYRALGEFRGEAKLSTWLVRIAVNESLARLRKRARSAQVIRLEGDLQALAPDAQLSPHLTRLTETDMPDSAPEQPERAALRAETRRLLEAKIDQLPDAFRAVFVLRALEELSVEETASALGIPEATVRSRFFRARGLLREALSREIDHAFDDAFAFAGSRCDRIVANVLARLAADERRADDSRSP